MLERLKSKKARPWIIAAIIVIGVIILMMLFGGRGQAQQGGASGPSEQLQLAQAQMQMQADMARGAQQTELAIAGLQYNARAMEIEATLAGLTAQIGAQLQLADLTSERELEYSLARLEAEQNVALAGFSTQQALAEISAHESIARDQIMSELMIAQSALQAQSYQTMVTAHAEMSIAQSKVQEQIAYHQAQAQVGVAQQQASAQKKSSSNNLIGAIAGGILGLFSDVRLKEDIEPAGHDGEIPAYLYRYKGEPKNGPKHRGYMAQDLQNLAPDAVFEYNGFLAVDYGRVNAA